MTEFAGGLAYDRAGAGEPLLLIHGLGGERHVWEPVRAALAARRDTIAVDLPGFGESPAPASPAEADPAALARTMGGLLDALGLRLVHVAGNSLGGWVALELAKQDRALTVSALCPAGFWAAPLGPRRGPTMRRLALALLPLLSKVVAHPRGRRIALGAGMAHPERVPREAAVRIARAYATAPGFDAVNAAMRGSHLTGGDRIRVPVTIAWAERDRAVGRPRRIAVPGARTLVLPDCGHIPMWDAPELVARVLLDASATASAAGQYPSRTTFSSGSSAT